MLRNRMFVETVYKICYGLFFLFMNQAFFASSSPSLKNAVYMVCFLMGSLYFEERYKRALKHEWMETLEK